MTIDSKLLSPGIFIFSLYRYFMLRSSLLRTFFLMQCDSLVIRRDFSVAFLYHLIVSRDLEIWHQKYEEINRDSTLSEKRYNRTHIIIINANNKCPFA